MGGVVRESSETGADTAEIADVAGGTDHAAGATVAEPAAPVRRVGRPPRLSRELILATAAELPLGRLTIRAVADRLGVDAKAISYYTGTRDQLVAVVAMRAISAELEDVELPDDWREAVRVFSRAVYGARVRTPVEAVDFAGLPGPGALRLTDALVGRFLDAGFPVERAGQALVFLSRVVAALGRDAVLSRRTGVHPATSDVQDTVGGLSPDVLPHLRRLLEHPPVLASDDVLERELDLVLVALEHLRTS